jgi:hypothetical protein
MIDEKSRDRAIAWSNPCPASDEVLEIPQAQEMSDFPAAIQEAAAGCSELQVKSAP